MNKYNMRNQHVIIALIVLVLFCVSRSEGFVAKHTAARHYQNAIPARHFSSKLDWSGSPTGADPTGGSNPNYPLLPDE